MRQAIAIVERRLEECERAQGRRRKGRGGNANTLGPVIYELNFLLEELRKEDELEQQERRAA